MHIGKQASAIVGGAAVVVAAIAGGLAASEGGGASRPEPARAAVSGRSPAAAAQVIRCPSGRPYFNYHEPLAVGSLSLASLFDGTGRVEPVSEAETLGFDLGPLKGRADPIGDNRTQLIRWRGSYYAIERLHYPGGGGHWNLFLFKSDDGKNLRLAPGRSPNSALFPVAMLGPSGQAYDPYVIVDYCSGAYDPAFPDRGVTFVMTFECSGLAGLPRTGGVCQSTSSDISDPNSWSRPRLVFTTSDPDHIVAGYPTMLWTGTGNRTVFYAAATREIPTAAGAKETTRYIPHPVNYLASAAVDIASVPHMLDSRPLGACARLVQRALPWDCNNRVVTDWKKEGSDYYIAYVGATYFDSVLPRSMTDLTRGIPRTKAETAGRMPYLPYAQYGSSDGNKIAHNQWAFSFARVTGDPAQAYLTTGTRANFRVNAPISDRDFAGISSPTINVVGGRMFVYFSVYEYDRGGRLVGKVKRSRILPRT